MIAGIVLPSLPVPAAQGLLLLLNHYLFNYLLQYPLKYLRVILNHLLTIFIMISGSLLKLPDHFWVINFSVI